MNFFSIMREKYPPNDHHFPAHKYGLFQTLFQFFSRKQTRQTAHGQRIFVRFLNFHNIIEAESRFFHVLL